jgi:3-isopropylmalate/(R)-2-methylmalate dehydratase large subunit
VIDHIVSTLPGRTGESHPPGRERIHALRDNSRQFGLELYDVDNPRQGIVHVIAPEFGITLPGCTLVCGDSHTATNGGLGALAWGIGTTEVMHVMAAQALLLRKPQQMRISFHGRLEPGVFSKDLILYFIGKHGVATGIGFAVEYAGPGIAALSIEERMTICNMSIEFGARMGIVAPDDKTIDYVAGRPFAPTGDFWDQAATSWRALASDAGARFEREFEIDCNQVSAVTWGTRRRTSRDRRAAPRSVRGRRRGPAGGHDAGLVLHGPHSRAHAGGRSNRLRLHRLLHQQPALRSGSCRQDRAGS